MTRRKAGKKPGGRDGPRIYRLSPRALNLYSECSRCFVLDRREGIKRPSGPFPSLPGGMDSVLKRHFDSHMKAGTMPPGLEDIGAAGHRLFSDEEKQNLWQGEGLSWENENGDSLEGKVDYILERDGKLVVLDFKTRGWPLKTHPHYYQAQVDIYNYLLEKIGFETEDHSLLLFYYPLDIQQGGLVDFGKQLVKMAGGGTDVQRLFDGALRTLRRASLPRPSKDCGFCGYAQEYAKNVGK